MSNITEACVRDLGSSCQKREKVLRELSNYGGNPSCDSYNYRMRRAAEKFFMVYEIDNSIEMFNDCCDAHCLNESQRKIVWDCMERNGIK